MLILISSLRFGVVDLAINGEERVEEEGGGAAGSGEVEAAAAAWKPAVKFGGVFKMEFSRIKEE